MATELDPREIAAAHVDFPGERLLTQATGCPQLPKPLHQGVHTRPSVTYPAQPVNRTIMAFRGQLWPIPGYWTLDRASGRRRVAPEGHEKAVGSGGRGGDSVWERLRHDASAS